MLPSTYWRFGPAIFCLSPVVLLLAIQEVGFVRAQESSPGAQPSTAIRPAAASEANSAQRIALAAVAPDSSVQLIQRDAVLGLAGWDHTLLGAFELGASLLRRTATAAPLEANAWLPSRKNGALFSTSGSRSSLSSLVSAFRLDQLSRNGMNLAMKSALGSFNLTYREIFTGRPNSLGGGVGQASAAAIFTTPRFGSGGKFDFSAAALVGTGSMNTLLGGGFGNSAIGGNGPGRRSQTSPTVAIKLTF